MILRAKSIAASLALLLLAACGDSAGPAISESDREVAEQQHPQLLSEFGGAYKGDEAAYLAQVGEKVADAAGIGGQCRFTLVNTDVVNAFAVPGCYIYVTRGLMGIVNNEAELASVLAHELGHITGNHSNRQQRRSVLAQLGVIAVDAITGSDELTRLAGAAAGFFTLRYSRTHEYDADDRGLGYLRKAGYDPYASADMLAVLQRSQQFQDRARGDETAAKTIPEWTLTHPLTENRIARARAEAARTGLKPDALPDKAAEYLRAVDGLLYGDDPEQGFVLARRFAHPVMRIAFEAPEGFTLTNSPQAVLIEGPGGTRGEFGGGPMPANGPEAYVETLLSSLIGDAPADIVAGQQFNANGVRGFMIQALVRTQQGSVPISIAAYPGSDGGAYHFLLVSQPGAEPRQAIASLFRSFRRLDDAEVARLRPRYIRVSRVGPGDTPQSLAARMAADRPAELLAMINGLSSASDIRPGESVKLVLFPR